MSAPRDTSQKLGGSVGHPSPAREDVGLASLWFGLGGGAAAWSVLTIVNYAIAAQQCYPRMAPLALPMIGTRNLSTVLLAVSGVAILIAVVATIVAFISWRRTSHESGGDTHWALDTGEGRTRFMAVSGLMTSAVFLLAIIVETMSIVTVHACW
jgi:hypothetical protein